MDKIKVVINEKFELEVERGTQLQEIVTTYNERFPYEYRTPIVLALYNGKLIELHKRIKESGTISWIDMNHKDGFRTYQRSLTMLLTRAVLDVVGNEKLKKTQIHYSLGKGFYCNIVGDYPITQESLLKIKDQMHKLVERDIPFIKKNYSLQKAIGLFKSKKMMDKVRLFRYRSVSTVNLYFLEDYVDYNYGYMVPSTGYLKVFDLIPYDNGFILQFMDQENPNQVAIFKRMDQLARTLKEHTTWGDIMEVEDVGSLNDRIAQGKINDLILVEEALQEKKIAEIADKIKLHMDTKQVVLIAGPSSSGKTTFAHRLSIQLKVHGIKPHIISVDNYFKRREETPKDEKGQYNFECLEALDVDVFNDDLKRLLKGERVHMPRFNFVSGEREYRGDFMELKQNELLVIEGIHCLNEALTFDIPRESKFKIYISALTQLNIDDHNRIPTTDARLIRRIVRDYQYRGASAERTINMWPSVRHGEESYIFPFQEDADTMFNSALIYELSILKQYAEPQLFNIDPDKEAYSEAKRLIKFLDYFLGVSSESVPMNSLLREFVGGSCFKT